MTLLPW